MSGREVSGGEVSGRTELVAAAARAAGKNFGSDVRELGVVGGAGATPERDPAGAELAERALDVLREEVERMSRLREQLEEEKRAGAPARTTARLDALAANIEGACRLALRIGILTPGEARAVWTEARAAGLHDRPSTGRTQEHPERPTTAEGDA
jgi:hypothetical protein